MNAIYQNFSAVLGAMEAGAAHARVSGKLRDLVQACVADEATGGTGNGKLTLELSVKVEHGVATLRYALKTKEPVQRTGMTVFYPTPEGNFAAHDPRQPVLPLREVSEPATRAV